MAALDGLERSIAAALRPLAALQRAVRSARKAPPTPAMLVRLEAAMRSLANPPPALAEDLLRAHRAAQRILVHCELERRIGFTRELVAAAREMRLVPRLISDRPEQWRLGPLTLHVDRRLDAAELRFARTPVATELVCDAETIL